MIKPLHKYDTQTTPFLATKDWYINNTDNADVLLYESTGSDDGLPIALEFVDYGSDYPTIGSFCDIALEQQSADLAITELGLNVIGIFYPELDPENIDGTYKRLIYSQIKTMFYNTYYDPTKMWGMENIDFPLSKTKKWISDEFRLINVPKNVFGDKIIPNSVIITDDTTDNEYIITDDGNCNLSAGTNLFSHQQEIRGHTNDFVLGFDHRCDNYIDFNVPTLIGPYDISGDISSSVFFTVTAMGGMPFYYQWQSGSTIYLTDNARITGSINESIIINELKLEDSGSYRVLVYNAYGNITSSFVQLHVNLYPPVIIEHPVMQETIPTKTASFYVSASGDNYGYTPLNYQWYSGSTALVDDTRITGSNSIGGYSSSVRINQVQESDTGSYRAKVCNVAGCVYSNYAPLIILDNSIIAIVSESMMVDPTLLYGSLFEQPPFSENPVVTSVALLTGSVITTIMQTYGNETSSINMGFSSGYIFDVVIPIYDGNETSSINMGFSSGYIFDVVIPIYDGNETSSVNMGFYSGSTQTIVKSMDESDTISSITVGLLTGSCQ